MNHEWQIETKLIQAGYEPKNGEPRVLPIYQSTTYKYDSTEHVAKLFDLAVPGHMYSRISNPTVEALETKIATLEGGVGALCTSSGQAASMVSVMNLCESGDHFIALSTIYGGTYNLFAITLKKMGIEVSFVAPDATDEEVAALVRPETKAFFGETIANPALVVLDIERWSALAHRYDVPLIVDNTFATPYLCRPLEHGADIVIHSTTKYMDGHATSVGGVIVDGGKFDYTKGKFQNFTEPDPSYHGLAYAEAFKEQAYITKARVQFIRDMGNYLSPQNAFLTHLGLETLHLRMERHSSNALEVASYLEKHEKVESVSYPLLENNSQYEKAKKYLPLGASGVISFNIRGTKEDAVTFMDSLKLANIVVHVADARTAVLHPASSTHRQMSDEELVICGISPTLIRLSVGIENVKDIIADLEQAFQKIEK